MFMAKFDILNHVEMKDLVSIHVFRIAGTGQFDVQIVPHDTTKRFVIDEKAKQTMEDELTRRTAILNANDPKAKEYMEEFTMKLITELQKHKLCDIEVVPDSPEDPYSDLRKIRR
jgi:hypothetical protein